MRLTRRGLFGLGGKIALGGAVASLVPATVAHAVPEGTVITTPDGMMMRKYAEGFPQWRHIPSPPEGLAFVSPNHTVINTNKMEYKAVEIVSDGKQWHKVPQPLSEGEAPKPLTLEDMKAGTFQPLHGSGQIPIEPKIIYCPIQTPTRDDPLGMIGVLGVRYHVNDELYGDWLKFTDINDERGFLRSAFHALRAYSIFKLSLINSDTRFVTFDATPELRADW